MGGSSWVKVISSQVQLGLGGRQPPARLQAGSRTCPGQEEVRGCGGSRGPRQGWRGDDQCP